MLWDQMHVIDFIFFKVNIIQGQLINPSQFKEKCMLPYIFNQKSIILRSVLNVFIDIQTSKELIQMDTDKMMIYGTFTMDDEKLTQS